MAHNLAYWAELVARLSTVSLSVVVLGITGYCSAEFGEDFMATYVVVSRPAQTYANMRTTG